MQAQFHNVGRETSIFINIIIINPRGQTNQQCQGLNLNCIVIYEVFVCTELPNDELLGIHTPDLPHLLL